MGVNVVQPEVDVLGVFVLHFHNGKCHRIADVKCFRFVCRNLTIFLFGKRIVGKLDCGDVFGFNIDVGVYGKLTKQEL